MNRLYEKEQSTTTATQWNGDNYVEVTTFILENIDKPIKYFTRDDKTIIVNLYNGKGLIINYGDFVFKKGKEILTMPERMFKKKYEIKSIKYIVKENV